MINKEYYGIYKNQEISKYTIINSNGCMVTISDFGATMTNFIVKDKDEKLVDIILGYKDLEGYFENDEYIGCIVAPNANRIAKGKALIDGIEYQLQINNGPNNLHTHSNDGAAKQVMRADIISDNTIKFSCFFSDGLTNLPGNREFSVTYCFDDDNRLIITYNMKSDKKTLFNPTSHNYFNLAGHNSGTIRNHYLKLNSSYYSEVDENLIPTGKAILTEDTPFDFKTMKQIGKDIDNNDSQLKIGLGYDHNFILDDYDGTLKEAAQLYNKDNGIVVTCFTQMPAIQVYTANYLNRNDGKDGSRYGKNDGICLETQYYPDAINHPDFPSTIIEAGKEEKYCTIYDVSLM